jgi:hypothetical protein
MVKKVDTSATDAATVAMLYATVAMLYAAQRRGAERDVLNQLTPREQTRVFAAEARHLNGTNRSA